MPGIGAAPPPMASGATNVQGGGMGAAQSGYASAQNSLNQALQANNNTASSQMRQLGQQLQQNQGNVQQMMTNRGLGNTTIMGTMSQAPLNTYNNGVAQVQNQQQMRAGQLYGQLANLQMAGGMGISQMQQPYAQTAATAQTMQNMMGGSAMPSDFGSPQQAQAVNYQNLLSAQQPLYFGAGQAGSAAGGQATDPGAAYAAQMAQSLLGGGSDSGE